jgi:hypothetical protein
MKNIYRVELKNGNFKDFYDEKEANAYESEMKLKEEQEFQRQRKAEEELKRKDETKKVLKKEIDDLATLLTAKVNEYKKATDESVQYVNLNGELKVKSFENRLYTSSELPLFWL